MIRVYILSALCLSIFPLVSTLSVKANVGRFFVYPILRKDFFLESVTAPLTSVEFQSFSTGGVTLPHWLNLLQSKDTNNAYLYGTPESSADSKFNLQIVGLNRDTYQTTKQNVIIELYQNRVSLPYYIDLPLVNMTLEQLLEGDSLSTLTYIVQQLWTRGEVMPTKVISPVPYSKSGVLVRFSGSKHFSTKLRLLATHPSSAACQGSGQPQVSIENDFLPRFHVDWCRIVLKEGVQSSSKKDMDSASSEPYVWSFVDYGNPVVVDGRVHSLFPDFLACVLIPAGILLLLVLVLACVMCCGRTGWEKRVKMTPEPQLVRYNSIRRASISLRQLSENRELALSTSSRSTSMNVGPNPGGLSDGEPENTPRSAPGTLQRKKEGSPNAPPPYRPPLGYVPDQ